MLVKREVAFPQNLKWQILYLFQRKVTYLKSNYRQANILPVVSKVFEIIMLKLHEPKYFVPRVFKIPVVIFRPKFLS